MNNIHPTITSADVRQDPTPGPWVEWDGEIQAADGSAICEMLARDEDREKWGHYHADANSRLICAAPDLLAALATVTWHLREVVTDSEGTYDHLIPDIDLALAAIAKAKGGNHG